MNYMNKKNLEELDLLFQFVPPKKLRKRITSIFFQYLVKTPANELDKNLQEMSEDIYLLIRCLEKMKKSK
jgi:hypothetical protein